MLLRPVADPYPEMAGLRRQLAGAADILLGTALPDDAGGIALLRLLEVVPDLCPETEPERHALAKLLMGASLFARIFRLAAPDSPGLTVFGGEVAPSCVTPWSDDNLMSVAGVGLTPLQAFCSCVGEGLERLSQFERPDTALMRASCSDVDTDSSVVTLAFSVLASLGCDPGMNLDWVRAQRLDDGEQAWIPADLCLRRHNTRRAFEPPGPLSVGCAAGPTRDAALLHALLEVVERDAAALWWRGGVRPRAVPLDAEPACEGEPLMARVRGDRRQRVHRLLDITADVGIPVVAAVSFGSDGHGFCCGTAAGPTLRDACSAALQEMCQMELAYAVVQAKRRERGDLALNDIDRGHMQRFDGIQADCPLLVPLPCKDRKSDYADLDWRSLALRLASAGFDIFVTELTHPVLEVPVTHVLCPALQQEPSKYITPRLAAAIRRTGGGHCHNTGIPLM